MTTLEEFKAFDLSEATVSLWIFKTSAGQEGIPGYTGRWVETTDMLDQALKAAVAAERDRITELQEYGLLAQTNESSALTITAIETHAGLIADKVAAETPQRKATTLKHIQNSAFYVIKLVLGDEVMLAIRKTDPSWRAKSALNVLSVYFADSQLGLDEDPGFNISKNVDFFVYGDSITISNKNNFESVLKFRAAHVDDFAGMQVEPAFSGVFANLDALLEYVADNKIQLRRASAIRQKGHYKNPAFMANLRANYAQCGLQLEFDDQGRIVPSLETCKDIMQALLDHRLASMFSQNIYDVQDTANVTL